MDIEEMLRPRLVNLTFDCSRVNYNNDIDSDFDSDLEDGNNVRSASPMPDNLFVIDTGGEGGKNMKVKGEKGADVVRTKLTDSRPDLYMDTDAKKLKEKMKEIALKSAEDILLKKCVIKDDAEKTKMVDVAKGKKALKRERKAEKEKTAGASWFNMAQPELTDEKKQDLEVLKMRKVLDGKTFYKKNDLESLPKYFQVGTIVENATDFYSDRIPKKMRKQTLVDELLQDEMFKSQQKKKYREALERQQYSSKGAFIKLKKLKNKELAKAKKAKSS